MSIRSNTFLAVVGLAATCGVANAAADLRITELFVGNGGGNVTNDWAEVTNFGDASINLNTLRVNDSSGGFGTARDIPSFDLLPGASVILLLEGSASAITTFNNTWGSGINVLAVTGSGLGLGRDEADGVELYLISDSSLVNAAYYAGDVPGEGLRTLEFLPQDFALAYSTEGVNGAYLSSGSIVLTGSPGVIPAPAAAGLLGLGGLVAARRRRA